MQGQVIFSEKYHAGGSMFIADPKKPVGGHVMAHASTVRLSVRKGKGEQRLVKVIQARICQRERQAMPFTILALLIMQTRLNVSIKFPSLISRSTGSMRLTVTSLNLCMNFHQISLNT